jgi:hypothetical protein
MSATRDANRTLLIVCKHHSPPKVLQIDFALTYLKKKTRKYPSNGFAIEIYNLVNLANKN